jgi:hypothetical protein
LGILYFSFLFFITAECAEDAVEIVVNLRLKTLKRVVQAVTLPTDAARKLTFRMNTVREDWLLISLSFKDPVAHFWGCCRAKTLG